jgi:hypothetical protein
MELKIEFLFSLILIYTHETGSIGKVCFQTFRIWIQLPPNWNSKLY